MFYRCFYLILKTKKHKIKPCFEGELVKTSSCIRIVGCWHSESPQQPGSPPREVSSRVPALPKARKSRKDFIIVQC